MSVFYTYAHYTPEGRLFYVGKGQRKRAYEFKNRNAHWNRIVAKYGEPKVEILASWSDEVDAFEHEKFLIACFRDFGFTLCNQTNGGEGQAGMVPWNKGISWSSDVKQKISLTKQGGKTWNKGVPLTEDCKQKLSAAMLGRPSWSKGKTHSTEHRTRTSAAKVGNLNCLRYKIVGTHIDTKEQVQFTGAKAVNDAGFTHTAVYMCIHGKRQSHKGYTWRAEKLKDRYGPSTF